MFQDIATLTPVPRSRQQQSLRKHGSTSRTQNSTSFVPPKESKGDDGVAERSRGLVDRSNETIVTVSSNKKRSSVRPPEIVMKNIDSLVTASVLNETRIVAPDMDNITGEAVAEESSKILNSTSKPPTRKRSTTNRRQLRVVDHCEETGEPFFEVDRIVDVRPKDDDWEVQIKWVGYNEMTWEPLCNLISVESMEEAMQKIKEKRQNEGPDHETKLRDRVFAGKMSTDTGDDDENDTSTGSVYAVERINDVRVADSWEVKIKWVGAKKMSWEPLEYLNNADLEEEARQRIAAKKDEIGNRKKNKRSPVDGNLDQHRAAKREKQTCSSASRQSA
eukprot:scaffold627_cov125-Cylindrotheca_fusiformis.AAC.14